MSVTLAIMIAEKDLPTVHVWNSEIARRGFDVRLDSFQWASHSGMLPATMLGVRTGFELYTEKPEPSTGLLSNLGSIFRSGDATRKVLFRVGSSQLELGCVLASLSALAGLTNGTIESEEDGATPHDELEAEAWKVYDTVRICLSRLQSGAAQPLLTPPLRATESEPDRKRLVDELVSMRILVEESEGGMPVYRLHKKFAQRFQAETQSIAV